MTEQKTNTEQVIIEDVSEEKSSETGEQYEMSGPSLLNRQDVQQPQIDPEMIAKLQQNPEFVRMMKEQEAKNMYEKMTPREKLRARLKQKQMGRMNNKMKEALESDEPRKHRKTKVNVPSK